MRILVTRVRQSFRVSLQSEGGVVGVCLGHGGRRACLIVPLSHCLTVLLSHCLVVSLSYCLTVVCLCSPHSCHPFCLSLFIPPVCINHNGNNPMYTCTKYVLNARFCACFVFIPPCIESMHTLFGAYTKRKKNVTVLTERPTCK
jgi:hypothetical protein